MYKRKQKSGQDPRFELPLGPASLQALDDYFQVGALEAVAQGCCRRGCTVPGLPAAGCAASAACWVLEAASLPSGGASPSVRLPVCRVAGRLPPTPLAQPIAHVLLLQAHPPTQAELASVAGQGRDVDLQDAYGEGEAGSSSSEDGDGEEDGSAASGAGAQQNGAAAAAQQQQQQGRQGKRGGQRGGRGPHAAEFSAAEVERRRGLWEQRIQRPEMQVSQGQLF